MGKHIEVIARGVCVRGGKVLLCHSKGAENTYLPGGHIEFKEEAKAALRREIREELGVGCKVGRFLGAVENSFKQKGRRHCEVNLIFEVEIPSLSPDKPVRSAEDWVDFKWVCINDLRKNRLLPQTLCVVLKEWIKGCGQERFLTERS